MNNTNLNDIQSQLLAGKLTMVELCKHYLKNAKTYSHLNAYIEIFEEELLQNAIVLDKRINEEPEKLGKLFGLVISIKDLICYKDHKVSAGSKILEGFESQYTATALDRLLAQDGLVIGRTNCDEFGMGSTNQNSYYGPTYNMTGQNIIPGGSSGGAAVSVQIDSCLLSLGSDTGGSVRQPASFCGLYGLKPTFGSISRYGLIAYASSFDQIGLMAKHSEDIEIAFSHITGIDPNDATSIETKKNDSPLDESRACYFNQILTYKGLNPIINKSFKSFVGGLKKLVEISGIDFKYLDYLVSSYYVLTTAEASSNLGRYDGVRYGYRSDQSDNLQDMYINTRSEGFGKEVQKRILLGTFVLSSEHFDSYYSQAQRVRKLIDKEISLIFDYYDFIVLPTTADVAWKAGNFNTDPTAIYLSDIFTVLANLTGIPSMSIPLAKNKDGFDFGVQVLAKKGNDHKLLQFVEMLK